MFIVVRSGASEERMFNLNCQVDALLRDITHRCPYQVGQEDDFILDLMDEEGRPLSIYTRKPNSMGTECLTERGYYLLVLVKTDVKGRKYYEPLIENLDDVYPELKDVFGIEALDGIKRQTSKTVRKKSRIDRLTSGDSNGTSTPTNNLGTAALSAMSSLRMKSKFRSFKKK